MDSNNVGPRTLADVIELTERDSVDRISLGSVAAKRHVSAARSTAKYIEQFTGAQAEAIRLDDLVWIDSKLLFFAKKQGVDRKYAVRHVHMKNKLLACAHSAGWACKSFELRQSRDTRSSALKGHSRSRPGINDDAVRGGVRIEILKNMLRQAGVTTTLRYGKHFDVSRAAIYLHEYLRSRKGGPTAEPGDGPSSINHSE
jgi:hypothetical protein